MRIIRVSVFLLLGGFCVLMCQSCATCSRQRTLEDMTVDLADLVQDSTYVFMAKKVFYALPSPVELSMLIKKSGVPWQLSLLNDPVAAAKYLTNKKMALNFGIYLTDLSYAGLFEQSQTVLRYKFAIKQLIEGLGLQSAVDYSSMQLLEEHINDKDAVLRILTDMYASCMMSLDEGERYALTFSIMTGGWVEAMFIATSVINETLPSNEGKMRQLVVDQRLTFDIMWQAMSDLKHIPDVAELMIQLSPLARLYDIVGADITPNIVELAADGQSSHIISANIADVTPEKFAKIREQIQNLRQIFTNT